MTRRIGALTRVETDSPVFALTFDDGPHPEWTAQVLDVLARHRARATFFVLGAMVDRHPDIVERIVAEGHALGVHSWSHASLPTVTARERRRQLDWRHPAVPDRRPRLFRPPFGDLDWPTRIALARRGFLVVTWNVSTTDWEPRSADELLESLRGVGPGAVVLLHDQLFAWGRDDLPDRGPMLAALERFLEETSLRSVTVPELLSRGRAVFQPWQKSSEPGWLRALRSHADLGYPH
ncbi:MAG: polysaccharide deacetylase family protein [Pseudomonadales bacterium]